MASAAFAMLLSRPSSRSPSRIWRVRWPMRLISSSFASSYCCAAAISSPLLLDLLEDLADLFFQRRGGEGLDDVAVGTRLGGGHDVFLLGLGGHHQHRRLLQRGVRAQVLEH